MKHVPTGQWSMLSLLFSNHRHQSTSVWELEINESIPTPLHHASQGPELLSGIQNGLWTAPVIQMLCDCELPKPQGKRWQQVPRKVTWRVESELVLACSKQTACQTHGQDQKRNEC